MDGNNMNPMGPDPNLIYGQNPQPMQPDFGGQPQPMQPDFGAQPQAPMGGQPGMVYQDPGYGQQPPVGGQPGFGGQPGGPNPPKSGGSKTGLIIGIIAGAVVLLGIICAVLFVSSRNIKGAEEVSVKFMNAFSELDFPTMVECIPDELKDDDAFEFLNDEETESSLALLKGFGFKIEVVLLGIICAVLFVSSRNIKGAEEVSVKFMNAFSELDFPTMVECIPDELKDDDAFEFLNDEETESSLALLKGFGFKIDDIEVKESRRIDPKKLTKDFNADHGTKMKFSNAAEVDVKGTMFVSFLGESQEAEMDYTFTCGKSKGKWYIVNLDDHGEGVLDEDIVEEEPTTEEEVDKEEPTTEDEEETASDDNADQESSDDDDEVGSITEILDKNTCPSKVAEVPAGVEDDPSSMSFALDGKAFKLPQKVSDLDSDWVLDDEYFTKGDEELDAGDTSGSYQYKNSNYDDWFYLYISTCNPTDDTVAYEDSQIRTFNADIKWIDEGGAYPEVILPKGITWGSSLQDVYDAYGDADSIYTYDDETVYLYYYFEHGDELCIQLDYEKGVNSIEYYSWSWNYD